MTIKYLTQEQWERLLKVIKIPRDRALFQVAYWRGLRASEVGLLTCGDWRPGAKRLYVRRQKNGISGEYVVSDPESKALGAWLRGYHDYTDSDPLFPSSHRKGISRRRLDELMKGYGGKAGLPPDLQHFHVLRHSIAVHLTDAGFSIQDIRDWLGHRSINSTAIYAQVSSKRRQDVAQEFYEKTLGGKKTRIEWKRGKQ